ncbi:hypothetical protein RJ641_021619 [Dillenia turbinata]|uniref:F-box domain-containing protein n=1 Tax=Dillenia turbinata TaxID=194707 RepID=A0AAN8YYK5_9MAGN
MLLRSNGSLSDKTQMEERKWEELHTDCLVNIFKRVGIESLFLDVPFVCKSWYGTTHNPLCWGSLIFPDLDPKSRFVQRLFYEQRLNGVSTPKSHVNAFFTTFAWKFDGFSASAFMRFIVKRSCKSATTLRLPQNCTEDDLEFFADECPALTFLDIPHDVLLQYYYVIPKLISKWKHLEILRLGCLLDMQDIFTQVGIHCKSFIGLSIEGVYIGKAEASTIINFLPHIKHLTIRGARISRKNLLRILKGCEGLVFLDATDCVGFVKDNEILKLAEHIHCFKCEGAISADEYELLHQEDEDAFL